MAEKNRKVTVLLKPSEFEVFDQYCAKNGFKKSTLITRLIREHIKREGFTLQGKLPYGKTIENLPA